MKHKIFINHFYFNYQNDLPSIEIKIPVIPKVGEYIDPWEFLTTEQEELILRHIEGANYMAYTYVREIKHEFEGIQLIYLYLDNSTFTSRNHSVL